MLTLIALSFATTGLALGVYALWMLYARVFPAIRAAEEANREYWEAIAKRWPADPLPGDRPGDAFKRYAKALQDAGHAST